MKYMFNPKSLKNLRNGGWNKGVPCSIASKMKISISLRGRKPKNFDSIIKRFAFRKGHKQLNTGRTWFGNEQKTRCRQENNKWKGETASYQAKHIRLYSRFSKTGTCEKCKRQKTTHWSSNGNLDSLNRKDWEELCMSCHRKKDKWSQKMWTSRKENNALPFSN